MSERPESGPAMERLIALARSDVDGYTRRSKTGKLVRVRSYGQERKGGNGNPFSGETSKASGGMFSKFGSKKASDGAEVSTEQPSESDRAATVRAIQEDGTAKKHAALLARLQSGKPLTNDEFWDYKRLWQGKGDF